MNLYLLERRLRFHEFQHPYVCDFVTDLRASGVPGLLTLENQSHDKDAMTRLFSHLVGGSLVSYFDDLYEPNDEVVDERHPSYRVDFGPAGTYSQYNWELFFHIPLFIATRLVQDQRHEEAMRWFHYIFNPTTDSTEVAPQRYWFFKPFRDLGKPETIQQILAKLHDPKTAKEDVDEVEAAIAEWRKYPFEPHRIARRRPGAYQKTVVLKYLDNLIAWGDKLFRRDTIESINEATQLYALAAKLLGRRPHQVPAQPMPVARSYQELRPVLGDFSNALVKLENLAPPFTPQSNGGSSEGAESLLSVSTLYFCVPHNNKLLGYWDKVEDRLFKIRQCMNIEGVVRELPLFEPPIDPALLVRSRAMGLDLASVLDELSAPLPRYRFPFVLQKARELCEELKQLGGLLLSVLEKKDAEELARLRTAHEVSLLKTIREARKLQIKEASETRVGLERAKDLAMERKRHYGTVSERLPEESTFLTKQAEAVGWQIASQLAALLGSGVAALPDLTYVVRTGFVSAVGTDTKAGGGSSSAAVANLVSTYLGLLGQISGLEGTTASYKAGLIRSQQDRDLQIKLAEGEEKQLEKQILAAEIREQIAEAELANHEKQIEQSSETEEFLRGKFTNRDLYNWMVSQVSAVYFQCYKLAYDMAKRTERAYQFELGVEQSNFVRFGSWDSLRKGLLAGEKLALDLRRLETAYLDQNKRTYELTRHVSLAQLDPWALVQLRRTGQCTIDIPEALYDLDYPGHYFRRIKSVSLTIPAVTGPYTGLGCTLTLLKHATRRTTSGPDAELQWEFGILESIATSAARNDAGLFELNFRDERRLPFEGAGATSSWRIELPETYRRFDYDTITDVVFHVSYTALEGGAAFRTKREETLTTRLNRLARFDETQGTFLALSVRHDFPSEWHRLLQGKQVILTVTHDHLPYFASGLDTKIKRADWLALAASPPELEVPGATFAWMEDFGGTDLRAATVDVHPDLGKGFALTAKNPKDLQGLWLLIQYELSP